MNDYIADFTDTASRSTVVQYNLYNIFRVKYPFFIKFFRIIHKEYFIMRQHRVGLSFSFDQYFSFYFYFIFILH